MSNATSVVEPDKKPVKYTDKRTFGWVRGTRGPIPQVWNKDFDEAVKRHKIYFSVLVEDPKLTLDELIALHPCPENLED